MPDARDIGDQIAALGAEIARLQAQLVRAAAQAASRESWRRDGARNLETWLVARLDVSRYTAAAIAEVAGRIDELPATAAVFDQGWVSFDEMRTLVQFVKPHEDREWSRRAPETSLRNLQREARRRRRSERWTHERARAERSVNWWFEEPKHRFHLRATLTAADGAAVATALTRLVEQQPPHPDGGVPVHRRNADALVQLASQALGADGDPDRATVVVHVAHADLSDPEAIGEAAVGTSLPIDAIRRMMCNGRVELVAEHNGRAFGVGRASRQVPAWLARQIRYRDGGCRFAGCETTLWIHVHHIRHWADGGRTDLDNLISLCGFHHRLLHDDGWSVRGDPNGEVVWVRPDGSAYQPGMTKLMAAIMEVQDFRLSAGPPVPQPP